MWFLNWSLVLKYFSSGHMLHLNFLLSLWVAWWLFKFCFLVSFTTNRTNVGLLSGMSFHMCIKILFTVKLFQANFTLMRWFVMKLHMATQLIFCFEISVIWAYHALEFPFITVSCLVVFLNTLYEQIFCHK